MQRDEGIKLVTEAICSGIFNDLGSGSNVDVCVITKVCCLSLVISIHHFLEYYFHVNANSFVNLYWLRDTRNT